MLQAILWEGSLTSARIPECCSTSKEVTISFRTSGTTIWLFISWFYTRNKINRQDFTHKNGSNVRGLFVFPSTRGFLPIRPLFQLPEQLYHMSLPILPAMPACGPSRAGRFRWLVQRVYRRGSSAWTVGTRRVRRRHPNVTPFPSPRYEITYHN